MRSTQKAPHNVVVGAHVVVPLWGTFVAEGAGTSPLLPADVGRFALHALQETTLAKSAGSAYANARELVRLVITRDLRTRLG